MNSHDPPVIRLDTHLEEQNSIIYNDDEKMGDIQTKNKLTKLTAWFDLNKKDEDARQHLYHEIPKYYVWKAQERIWSKRKRNKISNMIGRMYFVNPNDIERYSMRVLLLHKPGATDFTNLRTHESTIYPTFQACAIARGLLADDKAFHETLIEAHSFTTDTGKLRLLLAMILSYGQPSNPGELWDKHKNNLTEDILHKEKIRLNNDSLEINDDMLNLSLYYLNEILSTYNKTINDFAGMPRLPDGYDPNSTLLNNFELNKFIRNQTGYDRETMGRFAESCSKKLNKEQLDVYNNIIYKETTQTSNGQLFFVDGPGGN